MNYATLYWLHTNEGLVEALTVVAGLAATGLTFWAIGCLVGAFIKAGGR